VGGWFAEVSVGDAVGNGATPARGERKCDATSADEPAEAEVKAGAEGEAGAGSLALVHMITFGNPKRLEMVAGAATCRDCGARLLKGFQSAVEAI
jgi:hypothetical protein